jgi:2-oxoglutarate ferredoxin oxidoreductase subunit beta
MITPTTPFGKLDSALNPLELYLTLGVSFVASGFSSKPRDLANMINEGMKHPGFAMIHVQSPCTTYNDNTDILKGNARKGIAPTAWDIPEDHDSTDRRAAYELIQQGGIPLGILYQRENSESLDQRVEAVGQRAPSRSLEQQMAAFDI